MKEALTTILGFLKHVFTTTKNDESFHQDNSKKNISKQKGNNNVSQQINGNNNIFNGNNSPISNQINIENQYYKDLKQWDKDFEENVDKLYAGLHYDHGLKPGDSVIDEVVYLLNKIAHHSPNINETVTKEALNVVKVLQGLMTCLERNDEKDSVKEAEIYQKEFDKAYTKYIDVLTKEYQNIK